MAAAVLQPFSSLSLDGGILPPSPISQNPSRYGRSRRGPSISKANKTRGRGYSDPDDRDVQISKALNWVLKRAVEANSAQEESQKKIIADAAGWANCEGVLQHPHVSTLEVNLAEVQWLVASRPRFELRLAPGAQDDEVASSYLIRITPSTPSSAQGTASPAEQNLTTLTEQSENLPSLIVFGTSYANYHLIVTSGGIKRAGGQAHLSFAPVSTTEASSPLDTEVSIYVDLAAALADNEEITWLRAENGSIFTEGDVDGEIKMELWKKAVGRRADIGVLFDDGEVQKEIPVGLRGKGVKGKKGGMKGRGKGVKGIKTRSEDELSSSD
ncbi:MAG: hypothetical protein M1820_004002 [Bogoriella megaspora]|nr:MAG: hypothetical protein M1820_004002 [Bogoriella megaspora]